MESDKWNPWNVNQLEEFLYFCCPECNDKNQSKELFLEHALVHHPHSINCLKKFHIKEELLNCEVKLEVENNEENFIEPKIDTELNDLIVNEGNSINESVENNNCEAITENEWKDNEIKVEKIDNSNKKYFCNICSKKFNFKSLYERHMNGHSEKNTCSVCNIIEKNIDVITFKTYLNPNTKSANICHHCDTTITDTYSFKRDILTSLQ